MNSDRISPKERAKLAKHLQGRFDDGSIERFLISVSEAVDTMEKTAEIGLTDSEIQTSLEMLESSIRRLNNEISLVDRRTLDTVAVHYKTLLLSHDWDTKDLRHLRQNQPTFNEWLGRSLEDLRVMDIVFHYANSKVVTSNDQRIKIDKRAFIERVFIIYIHHFNEKPVAKQWLKKFLSELGNTIGIKIGKDSAHKAIKKHK